MIRCKADNSIERVKSGDFEFPLGVYPVEPLKPRVGYTLDFEPSDGDDESGDWEAWPDRYVFDAVVSAGRVPALVRSLFGLMAPRVYPILDILGHDAYREIDPYVSYDLVGLDRVIGAVAEFPAFFFEDGLTGFGAMTEEPFFYFFVDEHKIVTIRAESAMRERVERVLAAFDIEAAEDAAGVDAAAHEHRAVLATSPKEPWLLGFDEIVERLRTDWRLVLNIDAESNVDDAGKDLGTTAWWCRVRVPVGVEGATGDGDVEELDSRYAEVILAADHLRGAEEAAMEAASKLAGLEDNPEYEPFVVFADRMTPDQLEEHLAKGSKGKKSSKPTLAAGKVYRAKWADG
ncbi:MAG: hypothetical protein HRU70_07415 [Phycisphaeraceae bacterium]|nr:MAG: hypothetical protein HRU70_07415 [Phycisphaeraceae bacterium]